MSAAPPPIRPREVFEEIRKTVMGQDAALREVSVAVVKHLMGSRAGNILLIGNSGSGKTTLMRAVEMFLASRADLNRFANVVRINANILAEERQGYGNSVLARLEANARKILGVAASQEAILQSIEHGIVFIDEVDKIRGRVSDSANVRGIVAQEALLTLMENEVLEFAIGGRVFPINSSGVLFVAGGAFEELYDNVLRRATIGTDVVAIRPVVVVSQTGEVREELPFHLRDYLRYEDLFHYGMTPQFVSRFESIVVLNDLLEPDLARILVEPENSIFRMAREYFSRFGVDLQITRSALLAIAWDASRQKRLGARALRETFRRVISNLEFDPAETGASQTITIDDEIVRQAIASREQGSSRPR